MILEDKRNAKNVIVFDRGLKMKKTLGKLTVDDVTFVIFYGAVKSKLISVVLKNNGVLLHTTSEVRCFKTR